MKWETRGSLNSLNHFALRETFFLDLEHALGPTAAFSVFFSSAWWQSKEGFQAAF